MAIIINKMKKFITTSFAFLVLFSTLIINQSAAQSKIEFGGYLQNWLTLDQHTESLGQNGTLLTSNIHGFKIRRARLTAKASLNQTFSVGTWVEFANKTPSVLDFYLDATISEHMTIRAGQIMMPGQSYSTSRLVSSKLSLYERPAVTTKAAGLMGYNAFRDIGISAFGKIGRLWYGLHIGNGLGRLGQDKATYSRRDFGSGLIGGRMDFELIDGFTIGAHASTNQQRNLVQNGSEPFDINRTSWSVRASMNNFIIERLHTEAEYVHFRSNDNHWGIYTSSQDAYQLSGFYVETGYRLTDKWQILGRYDEMTENPAQKMDTPESFSNRYTLGATRFINDNEKEVARIHLNYSIGESGPAHLNSSILLLVFQVKFIP